MAKHPIQLSIPEPCHESWNEMTPVTGGRHCASCKKTVVDFTGMSDAEIYRFVSNAGNEVCGRVLSSHLDRPFGYVSTRPEWTGLAAGIVMTAAAFSAAESASAQVLAQPSVNATYSDDNALAEKTFSVQGRVVDADGKSITDAVISVHSVDSNTLLSRAVSDELGRYRFDLSTTAAPSFRLTIAFGGQVSIVESVIPAGGVALINTRMDQVIQHRLVLTGIHGFVYDERGNPLVNGLVELHAGGRILTREMSDFDGQFTLAYDYDSALDQDLMLAISYQGHQEQYAAFPVTRSIYNIPQVLQFELPELTDEQQRIVVGGIRARRLSFKEKAQWKLRRAWYRLKMIGH